jgi:hypothetical protein
MLESLWFLVNGCWINEFLRRKWRISQDFAGKSLFCERTKTITPKRRESGC